MKTSAKVNFLRFVALLVVLGGGGYYLSLQNKMWTVLADVNSDYIFFMAVTDSLFFLSNALILKTLLGAFDVSLSVKESLSISSLVGVGNLLTTLRGGTIGKAVYLKRKYTFPYTLFIAATSAVALINLNIAAIMGALAALVVGYSYHPLIPVLLCFFLAVNLLFCLLLFAPGRVDACRWKLFDRLSGIAKGLDLIRRNRMLVTRISALLFINFLLSTAELTLSYRALSIDISLAKVILTDSISLFFGVVKILPGNLGIYEGSIALSSQILGVGLREGLLAAGVVRVVSITVMLVFGLIFGLRPIIGRHTSKININGIGKKRSE